MDYNCVQAEAFSSSFDGASQNGYNGAVVPSLSPQNDWQVQHALPSATSAMVETGLQEGMWQTNLQPTAGVEPTLAPYPERPGEPDCLYFKRTGICGFGVSCRYNHPQQQAGVMAHPRIEHPQRIGQPECQYYLRTGICRFGATCKYHHPYEKVGLSGLVQLNVLGLPLRLGVEECSHYMRTGSCRYGVLCKFHHPQPFTTYMSLPNSSPYISACSSSIPLTQYYPVEISSWGMTGEPYMASPHLQASTFGPLALPSQGVNSAEGWNHYQVQAAPVCINEPQSTVTPQHPSVGTHQAVALSTGIQGPVYPYSSLSAGPPGVSTGQSSSTMGQTNLFHPERPGQPECQHYLKTGDCRFGTSCWYHHPKLQAVPSTTPILSPMGLPLCQGQAASMSPDDPRYTGVPSHPYVGAEHAECYGTGVQGPLAPYSPVSGTPRNSALHYPPSTVGETHLVYPERPGEQECKYYMKTGDCKFGITCRYHHPKDRPNASCVLSLMGLPLRPEVPMCTYYAHYGICKFGPTCKFDHPLDALISNPSTSLLTETPNADHSVGSLSIPSIPSTAGDPLLKTANPTKLSSKDLTSSSESAAPGQLAPEKYIEDSNTGTPFSNDDNSQGYECSSNHVMDVAASISLCATKSG